MGSRLLWTRGCILWTRRLRLEAWLRWNKGDGERGVRGFTRYNAPLRRAGGICFAWRTGLEKGEIWASRGVTSVTKRVVRRRLEGFLRPLFIHSLFSASVVSDPRPDPCLFLKLGVGGLLAGLSFDQTFPFLIYFFFVTSLFAFRYLVLFPFLCVCGVCPRCGL